MALDLTNSFDIKVKKANPFNSTGGSLSEACGSSGSLSDMLETKVKRLRPLVDRVLVRVVIPQEELVNGLVIPDSAKEKPQEGLVISVGNGRVVNGERLPVDVQVGQTVVFGKYSGNEVEISGEKLLLLREDELMGVYE